MQKDAEHLPALNLLGMNSVDCLKDSIVYKTQIK